MKEWGCESDCSRPSRAEVQYKQSYTSAVTACLENLHMDNFTFVVIYVLHVKNTSSVDQLGTFLLADDLKSRSILPVILGSRPDH